VGKVFVLPLTVDKALSLVRDYAVHSEQIIWAFDVSPDWRKAAMTREALECLRNGEISGKPTMDEFGNVCLNMKHFHAGRKILVECSIDPEKKLIYVDDVEPKV